MHDHGTRAAENNREALPGRPWDAPGKLPLGDDELLSKTATSSTRRQTRCAASPERIEEGRSRVESYTVRADGICSQDEGELLSERQVLEREVGADSERRAGRPTERVRETLRSMARMPLTHHPVLENDFGKRQPARR